jgi:peroxiredoxin Q/BCP
MINVGQDAPQFELPTTDRDHVAIPGVRASVLYFYPKDDTSGCTTEAKEFTATRSDFVDLGIHIVGVSPDSVEKHSKFIAKHDLNITLASDPELIVLQAYGVWVEKSMYGRKYMGVERSTFLISDEGKVLEIWRKVRVKGHVEAVLKAATNHFG